MARDLGGPDSRIRLLAPSWFDQVFGTGAVGDLLIDGRLQSDLVRAVDANPLTRGFGVQFGVIGRAEGMEQPVRANHVVRGPLYRCDIMLTIIIGPEMSKPPTPPSASRTHQIVAELFSTTLTCGLAVAGWIGAIGSAAAVGVTGGASIATTLYFTTAASLSTVQCVGGVVHSGLVLGGKDEKAQAMEENPAWKGFDQIADYVNLFSLMYVGRDMLQVKRALEASGVRFTNATAAEFSGAQAVTMGDIMKMSPSITNPEEVARDIRQRVMNTALLGLGIYSSSRDASGGYTAVKKLMVGEVGSPAPAPVQVGLPGAQAAAWQAAGPPVQAGLPGPAQSSMVAPRSVDTMLRYKNDEVAMISVMLLKKNY